MFTENFFVKKLLLVFVVFSLVLVADLLFADENDLIIPVGNITENALFVPVEVEGTKMEIIAVRDSNGNIRTAFNTCQVCNGSELAYCKQEGKFLVCQNCGNRFSMDHVGIKSGGCNPYPIYEEQRKIIDNNLVIPYELLKTSKEIFETWKVEY